MKKKNVLGVLSCLFLFLCLVGWGPGQKKIKIVTSYPMRTVSVGQDIVNGIKLALEEVGYKAGNFAIELVVEDGANELGAWNGDIEAQIAKRAVADPDVMVYLGTYNSGAAKVSIPITNQAGLVQVSPANTWPGLTKPGFAPGEPGVFYPTGMRTYFRVCPNDALQGPAGAVWVKEMSLNNVYILDDGEAYGKGIADIFEEKATDLGLKVLGHKTIDKKAQDFTAELNAIKNSNADLIYFGGTVANGAVPLVKGIKKLGMSVKFMGPDGIMEQAFIDQAGDAAEGVYVTVVGQPAKELRGKGGIFYKDYMKKYNVEPGVFSSFGYEAAKVVLLAIERAGAKDRDKILKEIAKIKDYDGLLGKWSFDQSGDTTLAIVSGNKIVNKNFVFEKILTK